MGLRVYTGSPFCARQVLYMFVSELRLQRYCNKILKARKKAKRRFLLSFTLITNHIQHNKESYMDININGNPGTGNTFTEVHIGTVQNYNPNATTVINNNYGDKPKAVQPVGKAETDATHGNLKAGILAYVDRISRFADKAWQGRYLDLWRKILEIPEVEATVYDPGKQKNTPFNRNLIANIIYMMCNEKVITETNATTLAIAIEGDKDHPIRARLREYPDDRELRQKIEEAIRG